MWSKQVDTPLLVLVLVVKTLLVIAVATLVPSLQGQAFLTDPLHFWQHESAYAGSQACKGCHAEIYRSQQGSHHAQSLRPAKEVPQLRSGLPVERWDRASDSTLHLQLDSGGEIQLQSRKNSDEGLAVLEWAFGSGVKGITPIARTGDGQLVESRLTWYASLQGVDFTTGSSKRNPRTARESLGRELTQKEVTECFGCHTTGYDRERQAPARNEMGVRCERCHGPGAAHIAGVRKGEPAGQRIFHPGRMEGFGQAQMCGGCHGTPPQDNDFDALRLLENTPHSVRFPSQRIVLSRCFNESFGELKCTTCHDPHVDVADEAQGYDAGCQSCHDTAARKEAAVCPVGDAKCSSCHMPKERVMRHSLFSDHWIRVERQGGG